MATPVKVPFDIVAQGTEAIRAYIRSTQPIGTPIAPENDPAAQAQVAQRAVEERRRRARASTILTGGAGDTSTPSLARRVLGV